MSVYYAYFSICMLDPDGAVLSRNVIPATAQCYDGVTARHPSINNDFAKLVFHEECLGSAKNGAYSSMWHVHGLASVLKTSVTSISPEFNLRYRSLFNRDCHPRNSLETETKYIIMWTRTSPSPHRGSWSANHFVPCYDTRAIVNNQKASTPLPPLL